jgi:hypothetical protein
MIGAMAAVAQLRQPMSAIGVRPDIAISACRVFIQRRADRWLCSRIVEMRFIAAKSIVLRA